MVRISLIYRANLTEYKALLTGYKGSFDFDEINNAMTAKGRERETGSERERARKRE